ncbi:MAG TPA: Clp protease N-terminal domain-containing protein [Actinomycetota bacterium]|nr:Clp protease N-terminal domain-containing protein [Actinomycetota bacterium]
MFERFSQSAREVVVRAQSEARSLGHNYIGTEHLLLGLLRTTEEPAARVLVDLGVDREEIQQALVEWVGQRPLDQPDAAALDTIGIDLEAVKRRVEEAFGPNALESTRTARARTKKRVGVRRRRHRGPSRAGHIPFTPRAKKVLELSLRESMALGHNYIGAEHILLGVVREGQGLGAQLLYRAGVNFDVMRRRIVDEISPDSNAG